MTALLRSADISRLAFSREDAMRHAGESPAPFDPDAATCARLCLACLSGSALMHPLVAAWLDRALPLMGEWIRDTYGTREKRGEVRS